MLEVMMFCSRCGAKIDDSSIYCAKCGHKLEHPASCSDAAGLSPAIPESQQRGFTQSPAIPESQRSTFSSQQMPTQSVATAEAQLPNRKNRGLIIAAATCVLVAVVAIGLVASGVIPLPPSSQSSASPSVAADGSSSAATSGGGKTERGKSSNGGSSDATSSDNAAGSEHPALSFYYVNLGTEDAAYTYPVFSGGPDDAVVSQLNERLEQAAREAYDKHEYKSADGVTYNYAAWTATVTYMKDDVVGLSYGGYIETGGPHGYPQCWAEVVNLSNGSTMDATEFVGLTLEERDQQTRRLVDDFYSATGEHDNYTSSAEVFEYYTTDELIDQKSLAYILTSDGVYTYFGSYVLGSYAFGTRTLLMCDLDGRYVGYVDSDPAVSYPRESEPASSAGRENEGESGAGNAGAGAAETAQQPPVDKRPEYRVVTDDFEFDIPEYWRGKVDYFTDFNDAGMSSVTVYPVTSLSQSPDSVGRYRLVTIEALPSDSPAANNMGDIIGHIAGKVESDDKAVVVRSTNWPAERATFFANNKMYGGSSQEIELMSALVDLISGGSITYSEARQAGLDAASPGEASMLYQAADVNYLNETLIPTLRAL